MKDEHAFQAKVCYSLENTHKTSADIFDLVSKESQTDKGSQTVVMKPYRPILANQKTIVSLMNQKIFQSSLVIHIKNFGKRDGRMLKKEMKKQIMFSVNW